MAPKMRKKQRLQGDTMAGVGAAETELEDPKSVKEETQEDGLDDTELDERPLSDFVPSLDADEAVTSPKKRKRVRASAAKSPATSTKIPVTKTPVATAKKKSPVTHPRTLDMAVEALKAVNDPRGSSVKVIRTWILGSYPTVRPDMIKVMLKKALAQGLQERIFVRPRDQKDLVHILNGRYKLAGMATNPSPVKKLTAKKKTRLSSVAEPKKSPAKKTMKKKASTSKKRKTTTSKDSETSASKEPKASASESETASSKTSTSKKTKTSTSKKSKTSTSKESKTSEEQSSKSEKPKSSKTKSKLSKTKSKPSKSPKEAVDTPETESTAKTSRRITTRMSTPSAKHINNIRLSVSLKDIAKSKSREKRKLSDTTASNKSSKAKKKKTKK